MNFLSGAGQRKTIVFLAKTPPYLYNYVQSETLKYSG